MRVLLIDADLRNPGLHRLLEMENSVGLSNYLSGANPPPMQVLSGEGDSSMVGMVKESCMTGVAVMTSGPLPPNPAELLSGPKLGLLLNAAGELFDIIVIDGPPVMGLADVPIVSSAVDSVVMVVEAAKTRRAVVRDALKRLHFARAHVVGAVLNKYHPKYAGASTGYYGYGYAYGWGYGYGIGAERYVYGQRPKAAAVGQKDGS